MHLELNQPFFLLALVFLLVLLRSHVRSLSELSIAQKRILLGIRCFLLLLIVFALCGVNVKLPTHEKMVVFLEDQSSSVDPEARKIADSFLETLGTLPGKPYFERVSFASTPKKTFSNDNSGENWKDGTDISSALELGFSLIPPDKVPAFVLLSDGNATRGDAISTALRLAMPVSVIPLPPGNAPEVQVDAVRISANVQQGEPFLLEAVVSSNREQRGKITVFRGDSKILESSRMLSVGENLFSFEQILDHQGRELYTVNVESEEDTILENNTASGLVFAEGEARILLLESDIDSLRDFVFTMREQGIELDARTPREMPQSLEALEKYDAVILSDVPASEIPNEKMELLKLYVQNLGGGLLMLGGERSFGLGGYYRTPIEEILPVRCDFEREKENPSLALALVIDRSGSMGGENMELAKDAAKGVLELLTPRDYVAVIAFDHEVYPIVPLQNVSSPALIRAAISTIEASGGTAIYAPMVEAFTQLEKVPAKIKHVILLTDGYSEEGDFEGITKKMGGAKITVSTVGIGSSDNDLLKKIAETGNGRHYECSDPQSVPQVFAKETIAVGKSAIQEKPFLPVLISPTEVFSGIDFDSAPPLLGHVMTEVKPTAQFILATEDSAPLLAWWRDGLGISVAFTSDAKPRWAAEWMLWSSYPQFWSQLLRFSMRKSDVRRCTVDWEREEDGVRITLDVLDEKESFLNRGTGKVLAFAPENGIENEKEPLDERIRREYPLLQIAPGRYETRIPTPDPGEYHFRISLEHGEKTIFSQSRGIVIDYPEELRWKKTNEDFLRRIADLSGGIVNPSLEQIFSKEENRSVWKTHPLWPWLLTAACVFYLFDVLLRRFDFFRRR